MHWQIARERQFGKQPARRLAVEAAHADSKKGFLVPLPSIDVPYAGRYHFQQMAVGIAEVERLSAIFQVFRISIEIPCWMSQFSHLRRSERAMPNVM
jgi:hypothetical protein